MLLSMVCAGRTEADSQRDGQGHGVSDVWKPVRGVCMVRGYVRLTCVHSVVDLSALRHLPPALRYLTQPLLVSQHHLDQVLDAAGIHKKVQRAVSK